MAVTLQPKGRIFPLSEDGQQTGGAVPPGMPPQWMPVPNGTPDCPPGLEYLTMLDKICVEQEAHLMEVVLAWDCKNKYRVMNSMKQQCYYAAEESETCMRQCCGPQRAFILHITDNSGREVFRVRREFKCCGGCNWCASQDCAAHEIFVEMPDGTPLGHTRQLQSWCKPHFGIFNAKGEQQMELWGPLCDCQCCCNKGDLEYPAFSSNTGDKVAVISKEWGGVARELFTNADNFSVTFPMDLDVKVKAVLLGTVFLIDFMYHENEDNGGSGAA